jgi:hypothetical protein
MKIIFFLLKNINAYDNYTRRGLLYLCTREIPNRKDVLLFFIKLNLKKKT